MELHEYVSQVIIDTKGAAGGLFQLPSGNSSLGVFGPELILCATMVVLLLFRVVKWLDRIDAFYIMLLGSAAALVAANPGALLNGSIERMEIFTGMLVYDGFTVFMRTVLIGFAVLFAVFTKVSGIPDREDGPDVYALVLGSTLGMCLMASANHLLMVFMAVEMASVPSYVLAGLLKGRRVGSEAALKYSVYGAGAAGVMLYGISLVAGLANTVHLPTLAVQLAERVPEMPSEEMMVLALGGLMIVVGLAFKLSAVPFHFWCPDVFEGASAEVGAFLSVASKAAALALLVRVAIGVGAIVPAGVPAGATPTEATAMVSAQPMQGVFAVEDPPASDPVSEAAAPAGGPAVDRAPAIAAPSEGLDPIRSFAGKLIALLAVVTCTFGNLTAYAQTNIKRLLAYSTIAHAGYMMMAVPPILAMAGSDPKGAEAAIAALAVYIAVYLFMNLGAFAVVAFLRNKMGSEEIEDYAGLIRRCPWLVICFALMLFALVGLPPLSGFIGKFAIFAALVDGYQTTVDQQQAQPYLMAVLVAGGINTAISLFYYLRVVKVMTMDPESETRVPFTFPMLSPSGVFVAAVTLPTLVLILFWDYLNRMALAAAQHLLTIT